MRLYREHVRENSSSEGDELLAEVLFIYINQLDYQLNSGRFGDLDRLPTLKRGVRLAWLLIDAIVETHPEVADLSTMSKVPESDIEEAYTVLQHIQLDLSWASYRIEDDYPQMKAEFDLERAQYFAEYQRLQAEDLASQNRSVQ